MTLIVIANNMKTIYTTLPIYNKLEKQCFRRGYAAGHDRVIPITCPRHRLPSFQWLDGDDNANTVIKVELISEAGVSTDITTYFSALPLLVNDYFYYNGDSLNYLLPTGVYYLKITTYADTYIYYSEWFQVTCVYENVMYNPHGTVSIVEYDTLTVSGGAITSAVNAAGAAWCQSNSFDVKTGDTFKLITYLTLNSGELPTVYLLEIGVVIRSNITQMVSGYNEISLTATGNGTVVFMFTNTAAADWETAEILLQRDYSTKYLILDFYNTCDLGDLLYHHGFTQTLWFESEPMENSFPLDDKGVENGEGRFVRTFGRQTKKYLCRTNLVPDYIAEVMHRAKLHDTITLTNLFGDVNDVYNLEIEHQWNGTDKYYATIDMTFDYNEAFVVAGCCNNMV